MSTRKTVAFTGMDSAEGEKLKSLFADANRRAGEAWALAPENDADMLVIDVDSLYGHMTWLKVHNSGRIIVALSSSDKTDADHQLLRPVTADALAELLAHHAGTTASAAPAKPAPAPEPVRQPEPAPAAPAPSLPAAASITPTATPAPAPAPVAAPPAPVAPAPVPEPV